MKRSLYKESKERTGYIYMIKIKDPRTSKEVTAKDIQGIRISRIE